MASPPALGGGTVRTAHGELPVPAPAVVELLRGLPTAGADWSGPPAELTTPTGAALLAHLASEFGGLPAGRLRASGLGAGRRELEGRPNVLRALLVEPLDRSPGHGGPWAEDEVELLEATIDDLPAELLAEAAGRLLDAGALDVWSTPATMKKSRPGTVLHVLARPAQRAALAEVVFTETSTFGLRVAATRRLLLDERRTTVSVDGETVRVRLGYLGDRLVTASPEYEDCRTAAVRAGRPGQRRLRPGPGPGARPGAAVRVRRAAARRRRRPGLPPIFETCRICHKGPAPSRRGPIPSLCAWNVDLQRRAR